MQFTGDNHLYKGTCLNRNSLKAVLRLEHALCRPFESKFVKISPQLVERGNFRDLKCKMYIHVDAWGKQQKLIKLHNCSNSCVSIRSQIMQYMNSIAYLMLFYLMF